MIDDGLGRRRRPYLSILRDANAALPPGPLDRSIDTVFELVCPRTRPWEIDLMKFTKCTPTRSGRG
jgi:hypothetical protein